jgi:hypothetical protein
MMQIGKPLRTIIVEPLELPVEQPTREPEPEPIQSFEKLNAEGAKTPAVVNECHALITPVE